MAPKEHLFNSFESLGDLKPWNTHSHVHDVLLHSMSHASYVILFVHGIKRNFL